MLTCSALLALTLSVGSAPPQEALAPRTPKSAWLALLAEKRADPLAAKLGFDALLAEAAARGLEGAHSPKSPLASWAQQAWSRGSALATHPAGAMSALAHPHAPALPVGAQAEREPNDTRGWAEPLAPNSAALGAIGAPTESDFFAVELVESAFLALSALGSGGSPLPDSTLELTDEFGGRIAFADDVNGLFAALRVPLQAGRYYARVRGFADEVGEYFLECGVEPTAIPLLTPGVDLPLATSANAPLGAARLELPGSGNWILEAEGLGNYDPVLSLRNETGAFIALNDDFVGTDSQIRIGLSAGSYLLYVSEFFGAPGDVVLRATPASSAPIAACGGGTATFGAANDAITLDLQLTGTDLTQLMLTLSSGPAPAATDTMLELYDSNWRFIASNDDTIGFHARLRLELPPGLYHAVARPFPGSPVGNVNFAVNCAATAVGADIDCAATTPFAIGISGSHALRLATGSEAPIELRTSNSAFAPLDLDSVAAIFAADGSLLDWNDDADDLFNAIVGARVPAGGAWAAIWGFDNAATGSTEVLVNCPLGLIGTPALGATLSQVSLAKAGASVATLRGLPGAALDLGLINGLLLVDFATIAITGVHVSPQLGGAIFDQQLPSDPDLAGVLLRFQTLTLDPNRANAEMSNEQDVQL